MRLLRLLLPAAATFLSLSGASPQAYPPPFTEREAAEVRSALNEMKGDERGPYLRLRWYCADGSVLPPEPYACVEHGGGSMYAEINSRAKQLAALGFHVGTVLRATPRDTLFDASHAHSWLRELVLQQYLFEVDDGWVLRRARYYQGARQIEDEEQSGRELLEWLLSNRQWTARNYFLFLRLAGVVPHAGPGGAATSERIRNLAVELADLDRRLQPLRVKIHSLPSRGDLDSTESLLQRAELSEPVRAKLEELRDALRTQYSTQHVTDRLGWYRTRMQSVLGRDLGAIEEAYGTANKQETLDLVAALVPRVRQMIVEGQDGRRNLLLADLQRNLLEFAFVLAQDIDAEWRQTPISREARFVHVDALVALAHGAGFLSNRERTAIGAEIARLGGSAEMQALEYQRAVSYISRSLDWATATARGVFGPVVDRYASVEPKAAGFIDAQLRGSILLPLSQAVGYLAADADRVLGTSHVLMGTAVSHGIRGLNAGIALRTLEVVEPDALEVHFDQDKIYVLPATVPELRPVAGVLTLDEGNLLSHVQLLARNLGIPNAAIAPDLLSLLRGAAGREVLYMVSPMGQVTLKSSDRLTRAERALVQQGREVRTQKVSLDTRRLRLGRTDPIPLSELRADASGIWVGPKAANLGQLAAYFPERVSAGVALPFGMFHQHVDRPFDGASRTVLEELDDAYRVAQRMRENGRPEAEIDQHMFAALARVRQAIVELPWLPQTLAAIERALRDTFGEDLAHGVFVRSDTNVEDLPQFSGAGLNLTVAHQLTVEDVLASIRRVWTSPFSERAYLWRKQILEDQSRVYPSVLLLESVHSDKSGVLITSGLSEGTTSDLTIAVAEGVGGAVEGEDAETILVRPDGTVRLLSQAKAPTRRALVPTGAGGTVTVAAQQPEYLLAESEIAQLRAVVNEWRTRFAAPEVTVWDIEYGFVEGRLWLFQIRPFVRFRSSALHERLRTLDREIMRNASRTVSLSERI